MKHLFTPLKMFAVAGVLSSVALVYSFGFSKTDDKNKTKRKIEKRIEIVDENGAKKVTVTTIENGQKKVETFTGEQAEDYIRNNNSHSTGTGNVHMRFNFDTDDTLNGKGAFDISMQGFGPEMEKEMQEVQKEIEKMMEELGQAKMEMNFDFGDMFKSLDSSFAGNNFKTYSFNYGNSIDNLDSLLRNIDIDINIEDDGNTGDKKAPRIHKRTVVVNHSVEMEDMGKKDAEKDLNVSDISFYPNPNGGNFTLRYKSGSMEMIEIAIKDDKGKTLYGERISAAGIVLRNIELEDATGNYVLTLKQGKKQASKKLVIH